LVKVECVVSDADDDDDDDDGVDETAAGVTVETNHSRVCASVCSLVVSDPAQGRRLPATLCPEVPVVCLPAGCVTSDVVETVCAEVSVIWAGVVARVLDPDGVVGWIGVRKELVLVV